jgi:hypothetical protein
MLGNRQFKYLFIVTVALLVAGTSSQSISAGEASDFDRIRRVHSENANKLFESALLKKDIIPLNGAFARLWLNRDLPKANQLLWDAQQAIIKTEGGKNVMTVKIASSEHVKWQMRSWNRIYQLFNDKSRFYPGRLDKKTQAMIEEMFWMYVGKMSKFERAGLEHVWGISGSENHEMMHYSNALLAVQALKNSPAYRSRKLPDGRTAEQHYKAFNAYYKHYCDERSKHGLQIEVFAGYGKYSMPEIFNMADLSEDPALRIKMTKLLTLIWTDWAVAQVKGVRGGGRVRLYQGKPDQQTQTSWGKHDVWRQMSMFLLDSGKWWDANQWYNHPIRGMGYVLATTQYRLPDVVMDIALDVKGRGEYAYLVRRVAKQRRLSAKKIPIKGKNKPWYAFDPNDPGMVEYDYSTPDYVMGSLMIDPRLKLVGSNTAPPRDLSEGYPALTAQNRYHAIVFANDVNARVVPQCEGLGNHKTYNQQQAVQHKNVLLVQRHANAKNTGDMRILFGGKGMKQRLKKDNGWLVLKEGNAWLGVKGFSRTKGNVSCGGKWDDDVHYRLKDGNAPVAFIAGRSKDYPDLKAFVKYLNTFTGKPAKGWFTLASKTATANVTLALQLACKNLPKVDGKPIDLKPEMLFDSPFMSSVHGSGVVTIKKGARSLTVNMSDDK